MARMKKMSIVTTGIQQTGDTVTKEMLDSAVANFNPDARPPVALGHPDKGDDRCSAYGRVDNPTVVASTDHPGEFELIIEVHYTDWLESMEDSGEYEGFSLGLYPMVGKEGWYIHHLAILGELPPAANIKVLEVVQLSALPENKHAITLSAVVLKESILDMDKEELAALVATQVADAMAKALPQPAATDAPAGATVETAETTALKAQMAQMQETTKASLVGEVKALAQEKGMSEAEMKPIIDTLESTDAVQLCNTGANGIVANMKAIIAAKPAATPQPQLHNPLFAQLGAGITLSNDPKPAATSNMLNVAEESGF